MDNTLLALGLFVIGFTFTVLFPASTQRNWKEMGHKPQAGDTMLRMMRVFGVVIMLVALFVSSGIFAPVGK